MKDILAPHRRLAAFVTVASLGALAFAYIAQYGFNLQPCILCLYQRKPYFVAAALGLLAFVFSDKQPRVSFALLLLCGVAFLTGMGISGFHTGVEYGWWKGLQSCGDALMPENVSIEELQEYITNRPIVRCDVPAWKLFGISMTGYNFILSSLLTALTVFFAFKSRKKI